MSLPPPRPGIMDITPYVGGESEISGVKDIIKLASNEGAFGPSPKAVAAYDELSGKLHRYPDGGCAKLRKALGEMNGLNSEQIVCGAGSDELLGLLCRAYAGPGDEVLYTEHGFLMYPIAARTAGATPVKAPEIGLTANVDELLKKVTPKTRIVFLANPNNPTGTYLGMREMERLRASLPDSALLVIDAAYAEFVAAEDYAPGIEMVNNGADVVMTRTFSKIYALGGVRLGWAYCPPGIADVLNRVRNPFNVGSPAQAAGLAALADHEFTERAYRHNLKWLTWTEQRLRDMGLQGPASVGNFVLARFPDEAGRRAEDADAFLKRRGIIVRRITAYGLPDYLRITIGREDEMHAVVGALEEFMQ
ncbi:MAG: histidinol-phosphate transaminase [Rhodospirillales bacterium RIFCSPLOWO2_12_FULL_58_28]|nr:MAG: histidinol-phosphate transaminase [Rhodospirillales bacterium RIFCSPLOWO2_02_FULL_58_16]OHC78897.1 MAG: histidinol-phosphate transaminase [Rhodospirillales bacterium RIFCSPLOWO2_12_FULL_58_28]